ncbi:unnamed protein product [Linum tenue]|uniref:protein-serine/threonine phosphatase n=1 Tax=Linum tenue TaxID=586396 RepID=A0AAV0Q5N3_9ROSI|nr:unnamed protein product [Linum tenue]
MGICYSSTRKEVREAENGEGEGVGNRWRKKSREKKSGGGDQESVLNHIPGRIAGNGSSKIACLHTQQGKKGTNQDAMVVWENFGSRNDAVFCGVFDGHGPYGHMVARKVRDSLPLLLSNQWKAGNDEEQNGPQKSENTPGTTTTNSEETGSECGDEVEESDKVPEMYLPLKKSMLKSFKLMDKELKLHPMIDCFCSGSTAVTLIKMGEDLIIGNVGDSRAVLATRDEDNYLHAVQLTVDLKPDLPREAARIHQCKGRVFALQDEPEVARVWLPNNDSPGLAMARAFGDFCLKDFGLISVPDLYYRRLTSKDEFIILASDGVWDVLSNIEAVDIVASAPGRSTAARALIDCAVRAWRLKYPTSKNDDCAVVCLFLDHPHAENGTENKDVMATNESNETLAQTNTVSADTEMLDNSSCDHVLMHSGTIRPCEEIVPVFENAEAKMTAKSQSKRSLAECISSTEEEEWSALEGITRVNSLLSIPRFLAGDRRSASWRKWL